MCIRDSQILFFCGVRVMVGKIAVNVCEEQMMLAGQDCREPVSYTHLRAHETVLDLVCRLLLEKKKMNQSNYSYHISRSSSDLYH